MAHLRIQLTDGRWCDLEPWEIAEPAVLLRLNHEKHTLLDLADLPLILPYTWCAKQGTRAHVWYAVARVAGRTRGLHHLLMNPCWPFETDHINGDGLDNRRANLRVVTRSGNRLNHAVSAPRLGLGILPPGVRIIEIVRDDRRIAWAA